MTAHVTEALPEFVLGTLEGRQTVAIEEHVRHCSQCEAAFLQLARGVTTLDRAGAETSAAPLAAGRRTALLSVVSGPRRFDPLRPRIAGLFGLEEGALDSLLGRIDEPSAWEDGPADGVSLLPVVPGPGLAAALTAIVRIAPGATFPEHAHLGREQVLVIQGGYREVEGQEFWRGDLSVREPGSSHAFVALEGLACLCCSVLTID